MSRLRLLVIGSLCLFFSVRPAAFAADLSPYLDSQTIAVVKINLKQLDIPGIQKYQESTLKKAIEEAIPANDPLKSRMLTNMLAEPAPVVDFLQAIYNDIVVTGKAEEVYVIVYGDALMKKMFPALLAIPVPKGASQAQIDTIRMQYLNGGIPVTFVRHGFIVGIPVMPQFATQKKIMAFAREKFMEPSSQSRPEIVALLDSQPNALLQIAVGRIDQFQKDVDAQIKALKMIWKMSMTPDVWKITEERLQIVPAIFQGLDSFHFVYDYGKPELQSVIRLKDESTAASLHKMIMDTKKQGEEFVDKMRVMKDYLDVDPRSPGMTKEQLAAVKNLDRSTQIKQQGNELKFLLDSAGMEALKTVISELGAKPSVFRSYQFMKEFEKLGSPQ